VAVNQFDAVCAAIRACRICRDSENRHRLPHEPRPIFQASGSARLLIASQAPGLRAHRSGRPFVDPSGDRLRQWLAIGPDVFYDPNRIAIAPMGFCFPGYDAHGGDLPPRKECAPAWRVSLLQLMPNIELILAIGLYAQSWHCKPAAKRSLTETVGAWRAGLQVSPPVLPLPHPSWRNNGWLKANPWFESELLPELRRRVAAIVQ
jgi:uracil-DNA glycosylase